MAVHLPSARFQRLPRRAAPFHDPVAPIRPTWLGPTALTGFRAFSGSPIVRRGKHGVSNGFTGSLRSEKTDPRRAANFTLSARPVMPSIQHGAAVRTGARTGLAGGQPKARPEGRSTAPEGGPQAAILRAVLEGFPPGNSSVGNTVLENSPPGFQGRSRQGTGSTTKAIAAERAPRAQMSGRRRNTGPREGTSTTPRPIPPSRPRAPTATSPRISRPFVHRRRPRGAGPGSRRHRPSPGGGFALGPFAPWAPPPRRAVPPTESRLGGFAFIADPYTPPVGCRFKRAPSPAPVVDGNRTHPQKPQSTPRSRRNQRAQGPAP